MKRLFLATLVWISICTHSHANLDNLHFRNISIDKGLSDKLVLSIEKDIYGFIWIGTSEGLNRYDGYDFDIYKNSPQDSTSISSSFINSIHCDSDGWLWIGTEKGINLYDYSTDSFDKFKAVNDSLGLLQNLRIRSIHEHQGTLFLGTLEGMISLNKKTRHMNFYRFASSDKKMANEIICMTNDRYGMMWIGTYDGLYRYNPKDNTFERFEARRRERTDISNNLINVLHIPEKNPDHLYIGGPNGLMVFDVKNPGVELMSLRASDGGLADDEIKNITKYDDDVILLGTGNGLTLYNIVNGKTRTFLSSLYDETSLPSNHIKTSYLDKENMVIWLGTENGLAQLDLNRRKLNFTRLTAIDKSGLVRKFVAYDLDVYDDHKWMVSREGVTRIDADGSKKVYTTSSGLQHRVCKSLFRDSHGILWVGTNNGVNWYDADADAFRKVDYNQGDSAPLKYIYSIAEDSEGDIVTNISSGLLFMKPERTDEGKVSGLAYKSVSISDLIHSDNCDIGYIETDSRGGVWFAATMEGLFHYDKNTGKIRNFKADGNDRNSLVSNRVYSLHADSKDNIWIGTDLGLCCYLHEQDRFIRYDDIDLSQSIRMITSDRSGKIWAGTINKLIMLDPQTNEKIVCSLHSEFGLDEITYNSSCLDKDKIWFGGSGGHLWFRPEDITINEVRAPLYIHTFLLWNNKVQPQQLYDGRAILDDTLLETRKIILRHDENSISLHFSLLNYSSDSNRYIYCLKGQDVNWHTATGTDNSASYTNLSPGHYTFCVKACNSDNIWTDHEPELEIIILPPLLLRWWAWVIYSLFIIAVISLAHNFFKARLKLTNELKNEKMERLKLEELNNAKMRFFTNVSHDFKTPLSLISGPVENLINQIENKEHLVQLHMIQSNALILQRLINQIMDLRRLDNGKVKLNIKMGDIVAYTKAAFSSFELHAKGKGIDYSFASELPELQLHFDCDKMEKILFNLISNAFKFTEKGGHIRVLIDTESFQGREYVKISVSDTGKGIAKEEQEHIFDRFYQGNTQIHHEGQGTGIGLCIVKDFVELHEGRVSLESEVDKGSTFSFTIPMDIVDTEAVPVEIIEKSADNIRILVVEDNRNMLEFIRMTLKDKYEVFTATDGNIGYIMAKRVNPDLIISDVMMPGTDGFQMIRKIRSEMFTCHIPVILLTAKSDEQSHVEAYEAGADAYINKPFSTKILMAKVERLITQRRKLQEKYRLEILSSPMEVAVESENDRFINTIVKAIEENIDNSDFGIQELCEVTRWSHQQVYRKARALTGESINEFIRTVRLKRAAQLLSETGSRVSEVMYSVGFNSHSYFTKCFKEKYGISPREYAENSQKPKRYDQK